MLSTAVQVSTFISKSPDRRDSLSSSCVTCFKPEACRRCTTLPATNRPSRLPLTYAPEIPQACLTAQNEPQRMARVAHEWQFGRNAADEVLRRYAHHLGLICNLFWSDELTKAQGYMEMGVDLVLTNATHKLLSLVSPPNR